MSHYVRKDYLYQQAKEEGYRSRAAFKLLELDDRYRLIKAGSTVLDLGSFPGGWLQVAALRVRERGKVVGVDLKDVAPVTANELSRLGKGFTLPRVFKGDVTDASIREVLREANGGLYDLVLSDMSPALTGVQARDVAAVAELLGTAFTVLPELLKTKGAFVAKAFPSPEIDELFRRFKNCFNKLDRTQLKSTRKTSNELYIIGTGFKGTGDGESNRGD